MKNVHIATYQDRAKALANDLAATPYNTVVRLGGSKPYDGYEIQVNSAKSVQNSIDKLAQKRLLLEAGIKTLEVNQDNVLNRDNVIFPCVLKGIIRSCGTKVLVANDKKEYDKAAKVLEDRYYVEPLFNTTSEYRLHCTRTEVFFAVKKFKRNPADIIVTHDNHYNKRDFVKPRLWAEIQKECLKAMQALDLDIACFDVLYCSANNDKHDFVIAEANTNPELLANTFEAYKTALDGIINQKVIELNKNKKEPKKQLQLTVEQALAAIKAITDRKYAFDGITVTINL
jgi:glutathione synthase/RimK-type ligase-like ATP-grasp enzyme